MSRRSARARPAFDESAPRRRWKRQCQAAGPSFNGAGRPVHQRSVISTNDPRALRGNLALPQSSRRRPDGNSLKFQGRWSILDHPTKVSHLARMLTAISPRPVVVGADVIPARLKNLPGIVLPEHRNTFLHVFRCPGGLNQFPSPPLSDGSLPPGLVRSLPLKPKFSMSSLSWSSSARAVTFEGPFN
jgi:hypothetical protein